MRKYLSFFRIRFLAGLQYRAAAWAGIATQFAWGGMSILMYRAFYQSGQSAFPMEFSQLSSYIWMQQAFLAMFMVWFYDNEIFDHITSGSIAYELCRPCDLYSMWFVKNMAIRLSRVVLRCAPILLVAALLPAPYGVTLPASLEAALLFPISMLLGFLVMVAFSMLVYISAFYTISPNGVRILVTSVLEFLAGGVLPIPFFPDWLRPVMYALPFASMQNTPYLIYVGHFAAGDALGGMVMQLFWVIALVLMGKGWMNRALKKVVVQGG
ncbi:MAG: ABC-2 family transporter protein [Clostridia bacterium]|nr:ABC-2 family transporter protein [Clostridia bacterium]